LGTQEISLDQLNADQQERVESIGADIIESSVGLKVNSLTDSIDPLTTVDIVVDKIINIGKKIWNVVLAGKPVVNLKTDVATALPMGVTNWTAMESWSAPRSKTVEVSYKNPYGMTVVSLRYQLIYLAGGSVNGKGKYIGYATIQPTHVSVLWGWTLNAQSSVPAVYNMGTADAPVAGMTLQLNWQVGTALNRRETAVNYAITGEGQLTQLK